MTSFSPKLKLPLLLLLLLLMLSQVGCLASYLVKSGYEQMKLLNRREPISKVLKKENIDPDTRRKLTLSLEARQFAIDQMGLKETKNYQTYVDIGRPYITYIVYVAKKYELKNHLFSYPIVGKLPYKGFFTREEAEQEARKYSAEEYDVIVRGVSAYSTLGWFEDPILSTMLSGSDHDMVNLILHESTHATLYIKSHADFNERLATFVGNMGTELFYLKKEGENSPTLKIIREVEHDTKLFSKFISEKITSMTKFYTELNNQEPRLSDADKNSLRSTEFKKIVDEFNSKIRTQMRTDRYSGFGKAKINNAHLLYFRTYMFDLSDFYKMYDQQGQNMKKFISYCKSLEKSKNPEQQLKDDLAAH